MARMREESERRGQVVNKQIIILDLKGLSLLPNQTGINIFKETIRIDQVSLSRSVLTQNYYPETLGHFFIINAPWFGLFLSCLVFLVDITYFRFYLGAPCSRLSLTFQDLHAPVGSHPPVARSRHT